MKTKSLPILLVCAFVLAFVTCKKEPDPNIQSFELTKEDLAIGTTSATIEGTYSYAGVIDGIKVCLSENGADKGEFDVELEGNDFSVTMTGLKPATEYQYHYAVDYGFSKPFNTETKTFTTLSSEKPTVKALEVQRIDSTTYRVKCQVVADGGTEVTERGICWNTFGDPVPTDDSLRRYEGAAGLFEEYLVRMEHLASGKKYYVRAYAKNAAGKTGWSEEVLDFETEAPTGTSVEIELSSDPEDGGRVFGGGSYEIGTQCIATAEANAGYTFVNWTENGNQVSSEAAYTFTVTVGRSLVANFTKQAYVIYAEVEPENSGTVTGATGYDYGEECTLTATPNTGYDFQKWTKGGTTVSTNASFTFPVTETATYKAKFKIKSYTIGVSANPINGGSVEGGGTYDHGQSCRVKATPADGYAFTNWTDDGEVASVDADYTFTVTGSRTLVANFKELQANEYSIQVSANPPEGGTVTGGGTYTQGTSCTVRATKNTGYRFVNWTENGNQVWDLAEYEFTVEGNRILVANFEAEAPTEYTITVSANPSNGGTVTGGGTYQQDQCTVEATANDGYTFINWTEDGEVASTNARYTFIVNSDRNLVANFQVQSYTISASANPTNGGTVTGAGTYNYGESCSLSATANSGYTFTNWTENGNVVSTNPNYPSFTVTSDRTLVANFQVQAPNTYNINVSANPPAGGTVTGGGSYQQGQQCTVTANENAGYTFLRWTENGNQVSTNPNYSFTVTGNRTLVAQFQAQQYTITATANPTNGGTISGNQSPYTYGQTCSLTATPANGYTFLRWTENGNQVSTNPNYSFTVTGNRTLVAQFQAQQYTITATANPTNGGTISGNQSPYTYGQTCSLTATPASGYTFIRWTENGNQVSTNPNYSFTVTGNRTLVAQFQAQQYTITATPNPTNGGTATVSGNGTFTYNQQCTLTATPNSHYSFTNWKKGNNVVSTDAIYTFNVTESASYTANFTQDPQYTITATANPTNGGSVSGGGTYYQGQTCNLTATPANSNYTFANWTENGTVVSTQANYQFTVNSNRTLVANFTYVPPTYTITVSANPSSGGTVSGGGQYQQGQTCTLTATNNPGFTFDHWTRNGTTISGGATISFTVTSNATYVAYFISNTGGHEYVDLGLPSGTLWATCNVGADSPEGYGDYFAWGETLPKSDYSWSTYQYGDGSTFTKYTGSDGLTTLLPEDDAATANWGSGWRMPTQAEWQELLSNTTNVWTTQNGVTGRLFTATNDNSLFLPAAGFYSGTSLNGAGTHGYYWSSSLRTDYPYTAWYLYFYSGNCYMNDRNREVGFTVRPVRSSRQN
jgi:uncharacterized protein (TIGR02145 family)/uncharacterized repeat protein (TIGR02543 family)